MAKAWEFDTPLDKEGWAEADLGTRIREEKHPEWPSKSYPVNYVAGGYYIVALESAPAAQLLSADNLDVAIGRHKTGRLRQLRLDLTGGAPATGTCRFDYIRIDNSRPATP